MNNLSFNDDQLYYLRSLCQIVYQETGVWHQLHSHDEVIKLLRYCCMAPSEIIYSYFCCFINLLDKADIIILRAENILMPQDVKDSKGGARPGFRVV